MQVVLGQVRLGSVADVVLGADLGVVLGLQVDTDAGRSCFLPWAGAQPGNGCVLVSLPTLLLGELELDYYVASGIRLHDILDAHITENGREVVRDITLNRDGSTADLIVANGARRPQAVSVGDLRVHWSPGQPPRLTFPKKRRGTAQVGPAVRRRAA
jgi:hypothetical protein